MELSKQNPAKMDLSLKITHSNLLQDDYLCIYIYMCVCVFCSYLYIIICPFTRSMPLSWSSWSSPRWLRPWQVG